MGSARNGKGPALKPPSEGEFNADPKDHASKTGELIGKLQEIIWWTNFQAVAD